MDDRDEYKSDERDDFKPVRPAYDSEDEEHAQMTGPSPNESFLSIDDKNDPLLNNGVDESDEEEDAFFSKSFALGSLTVESDGFDAAFAGGLRSIFEASDDDEEDSIPRVDDISDAERIQRDLELERCEALDSEISQNDADFLFEVGSKYEKPRAHDADFEPRIDKPSVQDELATRRAVVSPESILEAMLFVGDRENRPLSLQRACELIRNLSEFEALEILADLNERYLREGAPYKIIRDGDGYRLVLLDSFDYILARFGGKTKEYKLSQTALDVLALVAYKQPITLSEILEVRSGASSVLTQLVRRDLISLEKHVVDKKKISVYRTTKRFLKLFNLTSLDQLPVIGDIDYR